MNHLRGRNIFDTGTPGRGGTFVPTLSLIGQCDTKVLTMRAADFAGVASPDEKWSKHEIFVPLDVP